MTRFSTASVGIGRCIGDPHRTVGGDDFCLEEASGRRAAQSRIAPEPAAEYEAGDANRQAPAALNQAVTFRGDGVVDMAPDGPRPHRDRRKWSEICAGGTNASCSSIPAMRRVQISSESREFEAPR